MLGDRKVIFDVYDSVYKFSKKEWKRVVCLFANGELFQLKDWPPADQDADIHITDDQKLKL
jgi:hypothetical protein